MFQLIFCVVVLTTAQALCVNDTPFTNFTWEMADIQGKCIHIDALKLEEDKSKYEGRWYVVFLGMTPNKVSDLNCFVWDTFWEKNGHFRNFLHVEDNGTARILVDKGVPIDAKKGIYEFDAGQDKSKSYLTNTFFYLDEDINVWWEVECVPGKDIRHQQASIGFRRFADVDKNKEKLAMIYKELKKRGAATTSLRVKHENCNYPPERENPYIKRKKPKQPKCNFPDLSDNCD